MALTDEASTDWATELKENVMTGVSYMIPFVTIGGVILALGYGWSEFFGVGAKQVFGSTGSVGWFLAQMGVAGLTLMVPVLGGYIGYAIADRPGLAPAFLLSYIIQQGNVVQAAGNVLNLPAGKAASGYLGALAAGLVAGYVAKWIKGWDVPDAIEPMMPIIIIPVLTTLLLLPVVVFVIGVPVAIANAQLTAYLEGLGARQAAFIGLILGAMMAFDMGGPVNKVAYVFAVGLISEGVTEPMAAVMIAGMTPPLGMALSNFVKPELYPEEMYEQAKSSVVLGLSFITEGAIPYAAADPFRVIPSLMVGSAIAAALSMTLNVAIQAPHGGIWLVWLANKPLLFIVCLIVGAVVTAGIVTPLKMYSSREPSEAEVTRTEPGD